MRIYLVRHGKAADEGYRFDDDRPLTDEGRALMRRTAKAWAEEAGDEEPEAWVTSPLVRAVQTCEICLAAFGQDGPAVVSRAVTPDGEVSRALDEIEHAGAGSIAIVTHEPFVSELASHLLQRNFPRDFKKGAVLAVERTDPAGAANFLWFLKPAKAERDPQFVEAL